MLSTPPASAPARLVSPPAWRQLVKEDLETHEREWLPPSRLRPLAPDDSTEIPLSQRWPGQAVDCWHDEGWWEGFVKSVWDGRISVFFPGEWLLSDEDDQGGGDDAPPPCRG